MSICAKTIKGTDYQVNLCDKELIGTKINDTTISEKFYGTEKSNEEIINELSKATIINAIGNKAVNLVKKTKGEIKILEINNTPYTQYYAMKDI